MNSKIEKALQSEAQKPEFGCVDVSVLKCYNFATRDLDPENLDAAKVTEAVRKIAAKAPALFKPQKSWGELADEPNSSAYRERDEAFKASLRTRHEVPANEFASLDSALLDEVEQSALRRYLGARAGSYDRSILKNALARQRREGLVPAPDAA